MERKNKIIKGLKLSYLEEGKGKVIILLHGLNYSAICYKGIIELLSKKYRVIAIDIPGFGDSDCPKEVWTIQDYAFLFSEFFERLKIKHPIIIGHSAGGMLAIELALEKITGTLVLLDSAGMKKQISKDIFYRLFVTKTQKDLATSREKSLMLLETAISNIYKEFSNKEPVIEILKKAMEVDYEQKLKKHRCPHNHNVGKRRSGLSHKARKKDAFTNQTIKTICC